MRSFLATTFALLLLSPTLTAGTGPDPEYDRLDGHGPSGKKVHVIEWEGNLEVHVYPRGSLSGLGLKLDQRNHSKPVMVLAYRFDASKPIYRRAVLGINLREGFKAYRDESAEDYDKIIISNHGLSNQVASYKLDPTPTQLYPDGSPELAKQERDGSTERGPAHAK
jgi:hypothetical protein